jgi:type VI secretion system secreted protein VgrG
VQYQESYFHFLSRLMEEEGIGYTFVHEEGKHTMVLFDEDTGEKFKDSLTFCETSTSSEMTDPDKLWRFQRAFSSVSSSLAVNDYFQEKPTDKLYTKQPGKAKHGLSLDVYEHPGCFTVLSDGENAAKRRIEEAEWQAEKRVGRSTYAGLVAGQGVTVENCRDKSLNDAYILTKVAHRYGLDEINGKDRFENLFEAIPKKVVYRPPRRHRRPCVEGVQTAKVTGKSGDEICTDEAGRIKVKFYWDTRAEEDDTSSCWVRVATPWSGTNWGVFSVPRVGQEVIVQFEEGDPERPVVLGCLYNGDNKPPDNVKDNTQTRIKTQSTPKGGADNYNEIRITDKKGEEEFYIQAEKDAVTLVKNARTTTIEESHDALTLNKGDRTVILKEGKLTTTLEKGDELRTLNKGSQTLTLDEGDQTVTITKGSQTLSIDAGDQTVTVGAGSRTVTIKKDDTLTIDGNWTITVKGDVKIQADGGIVCDAKKDFEVKCNNFKVTANASAEVSANASMTLKASATTDLEGSVMVNVKGGKINLN